MKVELLFSTGKAANFRNPLRIMKCLLNRWFYTMQCWEDWYHPSPCTDCAPLSEKKSEVKVFFAYLYTYTFYTLSFYSLVGIEFKFRDILHARQKKTHMYCCSRAQCGSAVLLWSFIAWVYFFPLWKWIPLEMFNCKLYILFERSIHCVLNLVRKFVSAMHNLMLALYNLVGVAFSSCVCIYVMYIYVYMHIKLCPASLFYIYMNACILYTGVWLSWCCHMHHVQSKCMFMPALAWAIYIIASVYESYMLCKDTLHIEWLLYYQRCLFSVSELHVRCRTSIPNHTKTHLAAINFCSMWRNCHDKYGPVQNGPPPWMLQELGFRVEGYEPSIKGFRL